MSTMTRQPAITVTLPARFVRDWLDSADGEFFNTGHDDAVKVVRESARSITIQAQPNAIRDLRERAEYYVMETYDEPYLRGLQVSARAVLRHLEREYTRRASRREV